MVIWEMDAQTIYTVLDHYATVAEESNDLCERAVGLYLRDKMKYLVDNNE